jgi:hypothetical protein
MSQCSRIGHTWHGLTCYHCGRDRPMADWRRDLVERLALASAERASLTLSRHDVQLLESALARAVQP